MIKTHRPFYRITISTEIEIWMTYICTKLFWNNLEREKKDSNIIYIEKRYGIID